MTREAVVSFAFYASRWLSFFQHFKTGFGPNKWSGVPLVRARIIDNFMVAKSLFFDKLYPFVTSYTVWASNIRRISRTSQRSEIEVKKRFFRGELLTFQEPCLIREKLNKGAKHPKNFDCGFDLYTNLDMRNFWPSENTLICGFSAEGGNFFDPTQ